MKFDFQNATYSKLWDSVEGYPLLSSILNDPNMIRSNYGFWKEKFQVDPNVTPTDSTGAAVFVSRMKQLEMGIMMDMRAPLGDSVPTDKKGVAYYTGVIPDFIAKGTVETAPEREYKERMFIDNFGNDAFIVAQFVDEVQAKIDSADMTLSHMGAQLMSKGYIKYESGVGIHGALYKADIPAANFQKAGTKAWTDADCMILDQMAKIEKDMKESWGLSNLAMVWEIPYDMFHNVFLKNKQVIDFVKSYRYFNDQVITENMQITEQMFRSAIVQFEGLSPIVIIEEKQKDHTGIVSGWDSNVAVLRPTGYAGMIRHTTILDQQMYEKYGSSVISRTFAKTNNGLCTLMNTTLNNGNMKEWHTDLMMSAIPSLDEFLYHVIVDTTAAGEGAKG